MAQDQDTIISTDTVTNVGIKYFNEYDYYISLSTASIPNLSKKSLVPTTPRPRIENINNYYHNILIRKIEESLFLVSLQSCYLNLSQGSTF
jgi:hypothetical protein